jgi:hypothetical protein
MATKNRNVDVLSVNFEYPEEETRVVTFSEILQFINGCEYKSEGKIFNVNILKCDIPDCVMTLIVTTQDSDIPPKRNKKTGQYSMVQIDTSEEGFAYANILLYDTKRNILLYEINKNGCFPNQLKELVLNFWNTGDDYVKFNMSFPVVVRANEYQRMLQMDYYKKITIELFEPRQLLKCYHEQNDSVYENIVRHQIDLGVQSNSDTITIEQVALQKKNNPMGLSRSMIKGLVDSIKVNIADKGCLQNIQTLRVEGYTSDSEDPKKCKQIDIFADSFNESFRIPEVQVHSDVQQLDRMGGITKLYYKLLPEFKQITGIE